MALDPNAPDRIYQTFVNRGPAIQNALLGGANDLFASLAVIEFVWVIGWTVAHRGDVFDVMIAVTRQMIGIGFWKFLMSNWVQMAKAISDTFGLWGNSAVVAAGGTANMMPMGFLVAGLNLSHALWEATSVSHPFISGLLIMAGLIDIIVFCLISSQIMLVVIEAMLAAYLGTIMLAFGVSSFTRDFGASQVRYAISIGVKRMTLQLIAGLSEALVTTLATQVKALNGDIGWGDVGIMIATPIIILTLAFQAPKIAQDIVMGSHLSTQNGIISTARLIGTAMATAALSTAGAGAAAVGGLRMAGRQMQSSIEAGNASSSTAGRGATMARLAASNTAGALASDVGKRLSGSPGASHGYRGFRMAASMNKNQGS